MLQNFIIRKMDILSKYLKSFPHRLQEHQEINDRDKIKGTDLALYFCNNAKNIRLQFPNNLCFLMYASYHFLE